MSAYFLMGQINFSDWPMLAGIALAVVFFLLFVFLISKFGSLWLQAKMSNVDVSMMGLVGMSLRNVKPATIVKAQIMAGQAGLTIADGRGMRTAALEAHYLAGGDVNRVILAVISANRAGLDLDFDRAAAIDLSGRDLSEAVRTSIFPKIIDCPDSSMPGSPTSLSAIAKNGIELLVSVRVTVRTSIDHLIGGATEKTIIARIGQGIVSTIGTMESHKEALAMPNSISRAVLDHGIQKDTAYEIVSIDVATIDVGRNIGARIQAEQAEADTRVARASAECRRAVATALMAEMTADVAAKQADLVAAQADTELQLAEAIRNGQFYSDGIKPDGTHFVLKFPGSRNASA